MRNSLNWDNTINPSLDVIRALCAELGNPQTKYASVHIVGSNGKTSTTRLIEALLRVEGLRTGMTTSPALVEERERIQIAGQPITNAEWDSMRGKVERAAEFARIKNPDLPEPSDFEIVTAMALDTFAQHEVDVAVVEAGIGGTWDSTCVLNPAVVVITSVSLEHTAILGDTIEKIATDKAGAIKPGSTLVLSDGVTDSTARRIFEEKAKGEGAHVLTDMLESYDFEIPPHIPVYQRANIRAAIIAAEAILGRPLGPNTVQNVVETVTFPGRFEVLARDANGAPLVMFDGAHNPEAARKLADAIQDALRLGILSQKPIVALGVFDDKDIEGMIKALDPIAHAYLPFATPSFSRVVAKEDMAVYIAQFSKKPIFNRWDSAHLLLVTGSLSLYSRAKNLTSEYVMM